ncbi:hypothetical protein ACEPAF_9553 [Sanghuangporus sanghuang]
MPLDGHSYLVTQGWSGKGCGLREGAITRPLAIPQKKTLSGLGKDRDDAFPFWDHLYSIATKAIKIKIHKDEDESSDTDSSATPALPTLSRTSTGILSNRRPVAGTPVSSSGTATPSAVDASSSSSSRNEYRINIIATTKRDAARRSLYSRFFRGPVLGPDYDVMEEDKGLSKTQDAKESFAREHRTTSVSQLPVDGLPAEVEKRDDNELRRKRRKRREMERTEEKKRKSKEKRSTSDVQDDATESIQKRKSIETGEDVDLKVSEKKKKRKGKVDKETRGSASTDVLGDDGQRRSKKRKKDAMVDASVEGLGGDAEQQSKAKKETREERRQRKEEKRKRKERKEEKRRKKAADLSS